MLARKGARLAASTRRAIHDKGKDRLSRNDMCFMFLLQVRQRCALVLASRLRHWNRHHHRPPPCPHLTSPPASHQTANTPLLHRFSASSLPNTPDCPSICAEFLHLSDAIISSFASPALLLLTDSLLSLHLLASRLSLLQPTWSACIVVNRPSSFCLVSRLVLFSCATLVPRACETSAPL